jgi:hypothetical protein
MYLAPNDSAASAMSTFSGGFSLQDCGYYRSLAVFLLILLTVAQ